MATKKNLRRQVKSLKSKVRALELEVDELQSSLSSEEARNGDMSCRLFRHRRFLRALVEDGIARGEPLTVRKVRRRRKPCRPVIVGGKTSG